MKLKKYWVLTYSLNDYYGERDQFCCFIKFQKNIKAAILADHIENRRYVIATDDEEKTNEALDQLKRTAPDRFELVLGDHMWVAKLVEPFESRINK